jgi:tRNA nucleotidyltransferase (CCA-adding enzyme)
MRDDADARRRLAAAVPANVREVCATLARAGHQAVTVGGAVRDALLGRAPGDWDVATSAHPDQVLALFKRTIPTGLQHGTVTIVTGRGEASHVEVTTYRGEGAYTDARRPDHVTFGVPLVDDLARRDFRVNAMAYDPAADALIDPYAGLVDLDERLLRAVGPTGDVYADAVARFTEDGLRVMRAVRFAAVLEFALDPETERGIAPALPSLAKVSKERVSDELDKLLAAPRPSRGLAIAERTGIVALILPELDAALTRWGEVRGGRAAAVTAWLARVDAATPRARLAALLVELGDPGAEPRYRAADTAARVDDVLRALKFSNQEAASAAQLASIARAVERADLTPPEVRRLFSQVGRDHAAGAIELWRAHAPAHVDAIAEGERILRAGEPLTVKDLAVTGKQLMDALDLAPGPVVGRLLGLLLDRVLVEPQLNTREQLVALARGLELAAGR